VKGDLDSKKNKDSSMRQMLEDLEAKLKQEQDKLKSEQDSLRAAREAKDFMSQKMGSLLAEKENQIKLKKKAEKLAEELKRELDLTKASALQVREGSDSLHDKLAEQAKTISEQKEAFKMVKEELEKTRANLQLFQKHIDEVRVEYGGIEGVRSVVKQAKMKEESIATLITKLDNTLRSTENNLHCLKCWNLMTDPVVVTPCGHSFCNGCVKVSDACASCDLPIKFKMPCSVLSDLTDKFQFNRDAIESFKSEKLWENVLKSGEK